MRILVISNDVNICKLLEYLKIKKLQQVIIENLSNDPLDVMSAVCRMNPTILILDDDFIKPHSERVLRSIKKVNTKVAVIFITSDNSLELGREISQLGIQYYALKPLEQDVLLDSIASIAQMREKSAN